MFHSKLCVARDFETDWFDRWNLPLGCDGRRHRKAWELAVISETLESAGMLGAGRRGVGFGVGAEHLPLVFADRGCDILATDLGPAGWEIAHDFEKRNRHSRIASRRVDMNWLRGAGSYDRIEEAAYDFSWSICSLDHCGSVWLGKRFLLNQMNCLKAGGLAIHTAEYSFSTHLPREGTTSFFGPEDVMDVLNCWARLGHEPAEMDWFLGDRIQDHLLDPPPYTGSVHLKVEMPVGQWTTCIALVAKKTAASKTIWFDADEATARLQMDQSND